MKKQEIENKLKNCPAQIRIYNFLKKNGETKGAVRTVQKSNGSSNEWQVGSGLVLHPLYALVQKGLVKFDRKSGVDYYSVV